MKAGRLAALVAVFLLLFSGFAVYAAENEVRLDDAPKALSTEEPFVRQCEYGTLAADAVRDFSGADIALVNAGDLAGGLSAGTLTHADLASVFTEDRTLAVAEMTGGDLISVLEHAVSHVTVDPSTELVDMEASRFDGFCQISGLTFTYDASAPAGERVSRVSLSDGTELGEDTVLTVCATSDMLGGAYGFPEFSSSPLDATLSDALAEYLRNNPSPAYGRGDRINAIGMRKTALGIPGITRWTIFAASVVLIVIVLFFRMRLKNYDKKFGRDTDMK